MVRPGEAVSRAAARYMFVVVSPATLSQLNDLLKQGWAPVRETPMGGGAMNAANADVAYSLVLLQWARPGMA